MFDEKQEMAGADFWYRETGYFLIRSHQYHKSFPLFEKAVELTPQNIRALVGRSWARAKSTYYTCAIADMDKALKYQPGDLRAKQMKAYYTFLRTDFEDAMVQNVRGYCHRKQPDTFKIGALTCEEEVQRSIGKRGGPALRDHYDIIRTIAWKKAIDLRKGRIWKPRNKKRRRKQKHADNTPALYTAFIKKDKKKRLAGQPSELSILETLTDKNLNQYDIPRIKKSPHQPPQARTTNIDNLMSEKYFGRMAYDKWCLRDLKNDPRIASPNYQGFLQIKTLARKGNRTVCYRQNILRVREPFYSIKYREVIPKGGFLKRQLEELGKSQAVVKDAVENLIKTLRAARAGFLTNEAVKIANITKTFIDKKSLKLLPNKEMYLKQLYELIGLVHLDCYRLKPDTPFPDTKKRIDFLFGLPISREPSQDSVIKQNRKGFMALRAAIEAAVLTAEKRLAKITTPLESVWVYYDLARFSLDLKKYDLSRFYARKAIVMAEVLGNTVWIVDIHMLVTTSHVRQRNRNEAKNELVRTLDSAKKLQYPEIIQYIKLCIDLVENIDFDEISTEKVIKERETEISRNLIDKATKDDIMVLFTRIDAIPGERRLSIMPGVRFEASNLSPKSTQSKASIIPKSEAELQFQSSMPQKKGLELLEVD